MVPSLECQDVKGVKIFIEDWLYSWLYRALPYVSLIYLEAYDRHVWV